MFAFLENHPVMRVTMLVVVFVLIVLLVVSAFMGGCPSAYRNGPGSGCSVKEVALARSSGAAVGAQGGEIQYKLMNSTLLDAKMSALRVVATAFQSTSLPSHTYGNGFIGLPVQAAKPACASHSL